MNLVLIFGKAPTTYNKAEKYMTYNPQVYICRALYNETRDGSDVENFPEGLGLAELIQFNGKMVKVSQEVFKKKI